MSRRVDFDLQNEGSIFVVYPRTRRAVEWAANNLPDDAMRWAGGFVVEHRYIEDIVTGLQLDGLTVR